MIVAKVSSINFKDNPDKQTANYHKIGKVIDSQTVFSGNIKQVVADNLAEARDILTYEVRRYITAVFANQAKKVDFVDFTFDLMYQSTNDEGLFWGSLTTCGPTVDLATGKIVK
jgi:hypothetical protein